MSPSLAVPPPGFQESCLGPAGKPKYRDYIKFTLELFGVAVSHCTIAFCGQNPLTNFAARWKEMKQQISTGVRIGNS